MTEDLFETIAIGKTFRGSIVANIEEERKDIGSGKIKLRKSITLENGMIVLQDTYTDTKKIEGDYKELEFKEVDRPQGIDLSPSKKKKASDPKRKSSKTKKKAKEEAEEQAHREAQEKSRKDAEERAQKEAEELARKEAEELARKVAEESRFREEAEQGAREEAEEKSRKEKEENERRKQLEDGKLRASQAAMLERKGASNARLKEKLKRESVMARWEPQSMQIYANEDECDGDGQHQCGLWKYAPGVEPEEDFENWKPQEIVVYPPGKEPPVDVKNNNSKIPHGKWGYVPGSEPDPESIDWKPLSIKKNKPSIWVLPPGMTSPNEFIPKGAWSFPKKADWPPPSKEPSEPKIVTVYPPGATIPEDQNFCCVWKFGSGGCKEEVESWEPKGIIVYDVRRMPRSIEDTRLANGIWGYRAGAVPDKDGKYAASDTWFFAPDEEPPNDEDWQPQGIWTVDPENSNWPPLGQKPKPATVFPSSKAPEKMEDQESGGVWKFGSSDGNQGNEDWKPQGVLVYEKGQEPKSTMDQDLPQGSWGFAPEAKPDNDGNYAPADTWFFAPGEETPSDEDWQPQGIWTVDSKNSKWPPMSGVIEPRKTTVYSISMVPDNSEDPHFGGIWQFGSGDGTDCENSENWEPKGVIVYEDGQLPESLEDIELARGVWGHAPNAEPDEDGNYAPSDTWFFAAGAEPPSDDDWQPRGVWTADLESTNSPCMSEKSQKATVFPSAKAPEKTEDEHPVGIWKIGSSRRKQDLDDWEPQGVLVHKKGQWPEDPGISQKELQGQWGFAPNAEPDEDGHYAPSDTWFFAPGEEPPNCENWQPQGIWTLDPENSQWPPPSKSGTKKHSGEPRLGCVFPLKKLAKEAIEKDRPKGFWKYSPGKKVMDAGKKPREILFYDKGHEPSDFDKSRDGVWGVAPGAVADENGNYLPSDTWVFAPNETPPEDWDPIGNWVFKDKPAKFSQKLAEQPKTEASKTQKRKSKKERTPRWPNSAFVYPSAPQVPPGNKLIYQGIWAISPGKPDGETVKKTDDDCVEIMTHKKGKDPNDHDLKRTPHGLWGHVKGAVPDANGVLDPKDVLFYPPGQNPAPDANFERLGIWSYPGGRIEETISWAWEGSECVSVKKTEIFFMDTVVSFTSQIKT